jgi:hypothetical protein
LEGSGVPEEKGVVFEPVAGVASPGVEVEGGGGRHGGHKEREFER